MTHDRVDANSFPITHDFLASMLGVRRPSVTVAAGILQRAGFIQYSRGRMTILDRAGLEASACECYAIGAREVRRDVGRRVIDTGRAPTFLGSRRDH